MKKRSRGMLKLILLSDFLIFLAAFVVVNVLIPRRFEADARSTIEKEIEFIKQESDVNTGTTYLTSSVQFIYPEDLISTDSSVTNATYLKNYLRLQKVEKQEIADFVSEQTPSMDTCYELSTEHGRFLFAVLDDVEDTGAEDLYPMIIYLNIQPFLRYNYLWNIILASLFVFVSGIVIRIGKKMDRNMEETREAQLRFFQNSSHELKTPLMVIQGYADGILSKVVAPEKASRVILEESDQMKQLVEDLLDISKIDSRSITMKMERADIREVLYDSMHMIAPLAESEGIEMVPKMDPGPVYADCDEDQLCHAFENLLSNAVHHARSKVVIRCHGQQDRVQVSVADDGEGISEKGLPHVFERFYTAREGGTGIGLSLADEIVHLHRGTLEARNGNPGAVFAMTLLKTAETSGKTKKKKVSSN